MIKKIFKVMNKYLKIKKFSKKEKEKIFNN